VILTFSRQIVTEFFPVTARVVYKDKRNWIIVPGTDPMQAFLDNPTHTEMPLQLLLFVDRRPSSREQIRQIRAELQDLRASYPFDLQIVDVGEHPYLAEHFKLVATPALIKIHPDPRQILAGTNIVGQLRQWWNQWQRSVEDHLQNHPETPVLPALPDNGGINGAIAEEVKQIGGGEPANRTGGKTADFVSDRSLSAIAYSAELMRLSDEVFQLQREKEEQEHQLQFKDQIISMLAHDLRNPLTATSIALETLEMAHDAKTGWSSRLTPAITAQLLRHARTQTRAIDRMITDILQAARGSQSEFRIRPQQLNLRTLCLDVLDSLRNQFAEKQQTVETDIPSDLPMVLADGDRIRQVMINLLDNAVKYTPVHGTISVSVLHRTAQKVQVSICDNGPGIPTENQERIFEDRYRLERDEAKEGYGIGLSLCQRIVRAHYGQIWVDSTLNKGSCFHFTLPVFRG